MFRQPGKNAKKKNKTALWEYALRVLSGRAYSTDELREKLWQRAENRSDVAGVIAKLQEYGYLDDVRFAENFAASRLDNQGFGRARVLRDLKSRRVPAEVAARAVEKVFEATDEAELIEHFLQRKYRSVSLPEYLGPLRSLGRAAVQVSVAFWDDQRRALFEPGAPPIGERLAGVRRLRSEGDL